MQAIVALPTCPINASTCRKRHEGVLRGWRRSGRGRGVAGWRLRRDARHFGDAGDTGADLVEAVLAEGLHALLAGHLGDLRLRRPVDRQVFDALAHRHHREEADPAAVARTGAAAAADGLVD